MSSLVLNEQAEGVSGGIGKDVERFALVLGTVIQQLGAQRLGVLAVLLEVLDSGDSEVG